MNEAAAIVAIESTADDHGDVWTREALEALVEAINRDTNVQAFSRVNEGGRMEVVAMIPESERPPPRAVRVAGGATGWTEADRARMEAAEAKRLRKAEQRMTLPATEPTFKVRT